MWNGTKINDVAHSTNWHTHIRLTDTLSAICPQAVQSKNKAETFLCLPPTDRPIGAIRARYSMLQKSAVAAASSLAVRIEERSEDRLHALEPLDRLCLTIVNRTTLESYDIVYLNCPTRTAEFDQFVRPNMDHREVVILLLLVICSVNCHQNAEDEEDMLLDDQVEFTKIRDLQNNPMIPPSEIDQMNENPMPMSPTNDATNLEQKALERLIKALSEKDMNNNNMKDMNSNNMPEDMSTGPEIRMPSTGVEPVPLEDFMPPPVSASASGSEESSGEMPSESMTIWERPEVFDSVIGIPGDATEGATVFQLTAHHPTNLSMDFLCINPKNVICYSDKLEDNKYQLRIALSDVSNIPNNFVINFHVLIPDDSGMDTIYEGKTYTLNFSYEAEGTTPATTVPKSTVMNVVVSPQQMQAAHKAKPVFEFMPQFEHETYDIMVPEGMNENAMTMAIIYFMSRVNGPPPLFKIVDDNLKWFKIGEITSQQDPNRVVSAVKIVLKSGINAVKNDVSLPYQFTIEAMQGEMTSQTTVNVDILSFDKPVHSDETKLGQNDEKKPGQSDEKKPEIVKTTSVTPLPTSSSDTELMTTSASENELPTTTVPERTSASTNEASQAEEVPETTPESTTAPTTTVERTTTEKTTITSATTTVEQTTVSSSTSTTTHTPPTTTTTPLEIPDIDINLIVTGPQNGRITVSELLHNGESVPDVEVRVTTDAHDHHSELVDLELLNTDAFVLRPRRIPIGGSAQLIVADNRLLDYESQPIAFSAEIRATLTNNPNIVRAQQVDFLKKDELDHAPYFSQSSYEFEIPENSITGEAVGQLTVRDQDKNDELTFELFGENSELFAVNDNVLIVSCKTALPCLDREHVDTYYFSLVATDKAGYTSDPVTVIIHVNDKNDNSPKFELTEETMRISNGELLAPFVFTVVDADLVPSYTIETDGSAAGFVNISKIGTDFYQIKPKTANIPSAGSFELELIAKDPSNEAFSAKKVIKVQVKNTISKAHFRRGRYERTISAEKIHKGNPLVQLELEGVPIDTVIFVILNNNPGWLAIDDYGGNVFVGDTPLESVPSGHFTVDIGVIDRSTKSILAQTQFILTVVGSRKTGSIFRERAYTQSVSKEAPIANSVITIRTTEEKPTLIVISDSINAWNIDQKPEHFPASAISIDGENAVLNVDHTAYLRTLQFQVASAEDPNDRALITIYFSSDPVKVANKKKQESKPRFVDPWTPESMVIPVNLVEEALIGQLALSLPAYDPMTGNRIANVELKGQMAEFFSIDASTQDVLVAKRLDFESFTMEMKSFDLELIAGGDEYKTTAILRFQIIDIDDNTPEIEFLDNLIKPNNIVVMENSPPGTVIVRFRVIDQDVLDGKQKFSYQLSGFHHENFQIREMADHMVIVVSPAGELDRERDDKMEIVVKVADSAGNANVANLIVTLDDQNDNAPKFAEQKINVKVTENWLIGSTVTRLFVTDSDVNENGRLSYWLGEESSAWFEVDADAGTVSTAKSLNGLARVEPYRLTVICKDNGNPSLSAEAVVLVTVVEALLISNEHKNELTIKNPPIGFVLKLNENIPANRRIYQVQSQLGSYEVADIKYSITPITPKDDGWLNIDETSGEIFTANQLDYETTKRITSPFEFCTQIYESTLCYQQSRGCFSN